MGVIYYFFVLVFVSQSNTDNVKELTIPFSMMSSKILPIKPQSSSQTNCSPCANTPVKSTSTCDNNNSNSKVQLPPIILLPPNISQNPSPSQKMSVPESILSVPNNVSPQNLCNSNKAQTSPPDKLSSDTSITMCNTVLTPCNNIPTSSSTVSSPGPILLSTITPRVPNNCDIDENISSGNTINPIPKTNIVPAPNSEQTQSSPQILISSNIAVTNMKKNNKLEDQNCAPDKCTGSIIPQFSIGEVIPIKPFVKTASMCPSNIIYPANTLPTCNDIILTQFTPNSTPVTCQNVISYETSCSNSESMSPSYSQSSNLNNKDNCTPAPNPTFSLCLAPVKVDCSCPVTQSDCTCNLNTVQNYPLTISPCEKSCSDVPIILSEPPTSNIIIHRRPSCACDASTICSPSTIITTSARQPTVTTANIQPIISALNSQANEITSNLVSSINNLASSITKNVISNLLSIPISKSCTTKTPIVQPIVYANPSISKSNILPRLSSRQVKCPTILSSPILGSSLKPISSSYSLPPVYSTVLTPIVPISSPPTVPCDVSGLLSETNPTGLSSFIINILPTPDSNKQKCRPPVASPSCLPSPSMPYFLYAPPIEPPVYKIKKKSKDLEHFMEFLVMSELLNSNNSSNLDILENVVGMLCGL